MTLLRATCPHPGRKRERCDWPLGEYAPEQFESVATHPLRGRSSYDPSKQGALDCCPDCGGWVQVTLKPRLIGMAA